MPARLSIHFANLPVRRFLLEEGQDYLIGRGAGCDLVLDDSRVSRRHARLRSRQGEWLLSDLGSKNGLSVDGRPLSEEVAEEQQRLEEGCWISFGGLIARFEKITHENREREADHLLSRWQTSLELHSRLDPAIGLENLLSHMLESVLKLSDAERAFALLARPDGEMEIIACLGMCPEDLGQLEFSGSMGAVERVLESGRTSVVCDTELDSFLGTRQSIVAGGIRSLICLPLKVMDRLTGVIYADSREPGSSFTELDVEILEALASHAALAIAVARVHREVEGLNEAIPTRLNAGSEPEGAGTAGLLERSLPAYRRRRRGRRAASSEPSTWGELVAAHNRQLGVAR